MFSSLQGRRVFLLGATGTIGRATARALIKRGCEVVCFVRPRAANGAHFRADTARVPAGTIVRFGDVVDPASLERDGFRGERFDALISCMASRTGTPQDAWAVDHLANCHALAAAQNSGVAHAVLLSAICVQKPELAFQHAKLAFEKVLIESGVKYSIIRPTAFFKSLSGQFERVKRGKPFLIFGDGAITACKPISDNDLANYLVDCLEDETRWNCVLPIGGPGAAITPRQQGERLFALLGRPARFQHVPVRILDGVVALLTMASRAFPQLVEKAELARIGRYYATESMLVLNSKTGVYDEAATPATGSETLFDFYASLINGGARADRGEHAIF